MSIPNAAVTFPDATRTENTRCGSTALWATGQTQPSALRLNALLARRPTKSLAPSGFGSDAWRCRDKRRWADLGADMLANLFPWLLNIVMVALAAALLLSLGGW
jgi:hypothetical protein